MADVVSEVVRLPGYRLIRLQGGDRIRVPDALFREIPLRAGEPLDPGAYRQALADREDRHALEAAVRLLESQDRSSAGLMERLRLKGYSQDAARRAAERLRQGGYLDDRRFAQGLMARAGKKHGAIRIAQEMRRQGVPEEIAAELLEAEDQPESLQTAVRLARKAMAGRGDDDPGQRDRKIYAMLARRGFPPDLVRQALRIAGQQAQEDG